MRVSEIRVKQIRVNQGLSVVHSKGQVISEGHFDVIVLSKI